MCGGALARYIFGARLPGAPEIQRGRLDMPDAILRVKSEHSSYIVLLAHTWKQRENLTQSPVTSNLEFSARSPPTRIFLVLFIFQSDT